MPNTALYNPDDPNNPPQEYIPDSPDPTQDPSLDLTNPTTGNRGSGAPTSSPYGTNYTTDNTSYNTTASSGVRPGGYGSNGPIQNQNEPGPVTSEPGPGTSTTPTTSTTSPTAGTGGFNATSPFKGLSLEDTWAKLTGAGAPKPSQTDHAPLNSMISQLKTLGFDARPGPIDQYGRQDSMYVGNDFYRIVDSHDGWTLVKDDGNWSAWGGPGNGGGGNTTAGQGAGTGGADLQALLAQLLGGEDQGRQNSFFDQLQGLAGQYGQPVTAQDPVIKGQVDAFSAAQTRGAQQGQAAQAEANAYKGVPTGSQDAGTAAGYEAAALNTGNFQASEIRNELTQRRSYLQQTLSLYGNQLTSEQARMLQARIAAINAQLSNQQMTNQNNQFYDQLGLSAAQQEALLNAQLIGAMSGGS
jgi:hypothetical protein